MHKSYRNNKCQGEQGEPCGENTNCTHVNISGEQEGAKNIYSYMNLRRRQDSLGDGYFDPGSSNENSENSNLILSRFKRQL
jgi:hypothetical protein